MNGAWRSRAALLRRMVPSEELSGRVQMRGAKLPDTEEIGEQLESSGMVHGRDDGSPPEGLAAKWLPMSLSLPIELR